MYISNNYCMSSLSLPESVHTRSSILEVEVSTSRQNHGGFLSVQHALSVGPGQSCPSQSGSSVKILLPVVSIPDSQK